ncbi:Zinc finger protein with KRAB and SCAN domains 3 [Acipenser ruthenus]|uniref:Zinc finger protein with KRAB and SCAN domains 3 n=1 Tax=Acipenser ruthenus TaxID=7906 RepID=A0A444U4J3_ACIRT|nr:Zinc finger protein with KRAB and SCAN domains 3 [Acipenser ruthenus]
MTAENDPQAYLVAFERMSTTASWPKEFWASQGEAQAAYQAMTDAETAQYNLVKQAVLWHCNITGEKHRVQFREYQRYPDTRPRVVMQKLHDHMVHWLEPTQKTSLQMGEAIVVEQFCHVVGAETQAWIWRQNSDNLEDAVKLA